MNLHSEDMRRELEDIFSAFPHIHTTDIPGIDLYMDQVTTFLQDSLRGVSRDPDDDKFLTKTMINNYVKNKVLIPPVKKKYSREHMMLLIVIYYMKSFLSIGDIRTITSPVQERYAQTPPDPKKDSADRAKDPAERKREAAEHRREKERAKELRRSDSTPGNGTGKKEPNEDLQARELRISDIYESVIGDIEKDLPSMKEDILKSIEHSEGVFSDVPEEDRYTLQRFALICKLSAEVYMRKLFIEKLLDTD